MPYNYCLHLAVLLAGVTAAQLTESETGLTKLQSGNADARCTEPILTYTCYTAGKGATEVTLDNETVHEFSHSIYAGGSDVNRSSPDGSITAGNLMRSQTQQCVDQLANGSASFCYRTVIKVHLTDQTRCRMIGCRTRFRPDDMDKLVYYGNETIAREPPAPRNLRNMTESEGTVTFTWDPGSVSCSNARYSVTTSNCGSCGDQSTSTTFTNITCSELIPEQQCLISVQSVLECGVPSDSATLMFAIEAAPVSTAKPVTGSTVNVGAIAGGVLGGLALIGIIVIVIIVIVIIVAVIWRRKQGSANFHGAGSAKRSVTDVEQATKDTETSHDQGDKQEEEALHNPKEPPSNKNESILTVEEDFSVDTKPNQRLLSSPPNKNTSTGVTTEAFTQEALPLHQISSDSSNTADGDQKSLVEAESNLQNDHTKTYTLQSSEESSSSMEIAVAEESSGNVDLKLDSANFVAISSSKTAHSGMPSPRVHGLGVIHEESPPATATTRGMEPLQFGMQPTLESFSGPAGNERELEEAACRETTVTVADAVCRQDPLPEKQYGLSEQGMLLSQVKFDEEKAPTTPVPTTDNEVNSQPKFAGITQYSNGAGASQMADITKRLEQLECGREEQGKELKELKTDREEQKKEIEEQKEEIKELKTNQEEHRRQMEESKLKINKLEAEARMSELKVGDLLDKVEQLSKQLEEKEKRNVELVEANMTEQTKHQEEMEKLQQKHQEEKETLKEEIEVVRKELKDEINKRQSVEEELKRERKKAEKLEKMVKTHESSSLGQLRSGNPKLLKMRSCPVENMN